MMVVTTLGVTSKVNFNTLSYMVDREWMNLKHFEYYEDYSSTPWNMVIRGDEKEILDVLRELDRERIYYKITTPLPAV